MKMWFRGDRESQVKKSTSRKGTLSDELSKASRIGRQLRYDEDKLSDNNPPTPWRRQTVKPDHVIKYASKDTVEVAKTIIGDKPQEIEDMPIITLGDSQACDYKEQYASEATYEEANGQSYEAVYEETYEKQYGVLDEKKQEESRLLFKKSKLKLKANITITFELEDIELLNNNVASVMALLNSSGEQFDFKITHDGKGGQNLNIIAPTSTIEQILALFE